MHFVNKSELAPELVCTLCSTPWWPETAIACPECDALYCRACIEDHLAKSTTCPGCKTDVNLDNFRRPPRPLRSLSERSVLVRCPNKPASCWSGPWGELASHLKNCPFDPTKVKFKGPIPDELSCAVCLNALDKPETAPCCDQSYCSACIRSALQVKRECPHCRAELFEELLMEARPSLVNVLARLEVLCPSECGWHGVKAAVKDHLSTCGSRTGTAPVVSTPAPAGTKPVEPVHTPVPAPAPSPATAVPPAVIADSPARPAGPVPEVTLTTRNYHPSIHSSNDVLPFITMAHLAAPALVQKAQSNRKSLHISAVMDISGSMRGEKLRLAKESLQFVVNELKDDDRFGLIAFDDKVEERFAAADMAGKGKQLAAAAIERLRDRGSTNLSGGLFAGIAQARDLPFTTPGTVNFQANARQHADPAASVAANPGLMTRIFSSFRSSNTVAPSGSDYPPSAASTQIVAAPKQQAPSVFVPEFDFTIGFNASPCRVNGEWKARFGFELKGAMPAGVRMSIRSSDDVVHQLLGAPVQFANAACDKPFFVMVTASGDASMPPVAFQMNPDAEKGVGSFKFSCAGFGKPEVKRSRIVMLFTDGSANAGITDAAQLTAKTRTILEALPEKDVTIFTFGFGEGHNASLLQGLAEISQGTYYFVKDTSQLKEIFADCIGGLLSIVATDLKLTIRPTLGVQIKEVKSTFPQKKEANGSVLVTIKDLYADEVRDVVVELLAAPRRAGPAAPLVVWTLSYENVAAGKAAIAEASSMVPTVEDAFTGTPDVEVDQQLARYNATKAMEEAQRLADAGNVAQANAYLRSCREHLTAQTSANTTYTKTLAEDLKMAEAQTMSASVWTSQGQKQVSRMKASHAQQRSNCVDADAPCFYSTEAKVESRKKAAK